VSQQINLFNPIFLKQKKHFSARTMLQGLIVIAGAAVALYALQVYQLSALRTQERSMRVQAEHVTQQLVAMGSRRSDRGLEEELKGAEADLKVMQDLSAAVQGAVGANAGFSQYLAAFARRPVSGLWLTGLTVTVDDLEVRGRALRPELLPVFIRSLNHEEALRGRGFFELKVTSREDEPKPAAAKAAAAEAPQRFVEFALGTRSDRSPTP
jgi:hypothetical protein